MGEPINRSRAWGAAGSIAAHIVIATVAIWSLRTPGPPAEPQTVRVNLIPLSALATTPRARHRAARTEPPQPRPPPVPPKQGAEAAPVSPRPSAIPPNPAPDHPDNVSTARAFLRAAVGCANEERLQLTAAERARCADRFANAADPNRPWGLPISVGKRAAYDAEVEARKLARRPDLMGCVLGFDAGGIKPVSGPGYGEKLGPLPCYTGDGRALKSQDIHKGQVRSDPGP